jgi:DNA-binding MarR family transcriptional regulator
MEHSDFIGHRINVLARMSAKRQNEKFFHTGLTSCQYSVILCLVEHGALIQSKIREQLYIEASTLSRTLDNMEKCDWIVRIVDENDKREKRVELTEKAREHFPELLQMIDDLQGQILNGILLEDLDVFNRVLEQVRENLIASGNG